MTTTSLILLIGLVITFLIIYIAINIPTKCPKCGTPMNHIIYARFGYEVDSLICPICKHEIILNDEAWHQNENL